MPLFAGLSVITGGDKSTTLDVGANTDSGYHLLAVKEYSRTIEQIPNGKSVRSGPFMIGGHQWCIHYCPNGYDPSWGDFISLHLCRVDVEDETEVHVEAKFEFSFVDQFEYQKPIDIHANETRDFSTKGNGWCSMNFMKRDALERSAYLKDDSFTIRCDILVCNDLNTSKDADGTLSYMQDDFNILLQNKVGADVTFEVGGEMFAAHRCVLAARSTVFMAQLFGPMMEGTTSSIIQIKDMDAKVFAALLSFIYTDSFPEMDEDNCMEEEEGQDEEEGENDVMWLQELLVAADRYDIQRLQFLCEKRLSEHIDVSSVVSILALAEQQHCHRLKEACLQFIQVQSPNCLAKLMATDGWGHMIRVYPSVLNELTVKLASSQKEDKKRKQ